MFTLWKQEMFAICVLFLLLCVCPNGISANMQELAIVLEGVKHHDQLIKSCRVSFTMTAFIGEKYNLASKGSRTKSTEGECFFCDGMFALTEVNPPEPWPDNPGQLAPKWILKQIYDRERLMEVYIHEPDSKPWCEVFYYPKDRFSTTFLHRYSPLFWTKVEGLPLDKFVDIYVKTPSESVQPKGYELIQGDRCFRISLINPTSDMDIVVNLDRGYRVQEIYSTIKEGSTMENHTLMSVQKVEWKHYKDDIWYPASTYYELYLINDNSKERKTHFREKIQFKNFEANIKLPEDIFLTKPPPGAESVTHF